MKVYLVMEENWETGDKKIVGGYKTYEKAMNFINKCVEGKNIYKRFEDIVCVRTGEDEDYDEYTAEFDYRIYIVEQNII